MNQAPQATQLLEEQKERFVGRAERSAGTPEEVEATCEACGKVTVFPGSDAGTVQNCAHCRAYLDVPGGDDSDWLAEAEGAEEAEDPHRRRNPIAPNPAVQSIQLPQSVNLVLGWDCALWAEYGSWTAFFWPACGP